MNPTAPASSAPDDRSDAIGMNENPGVRLAQPIAWPDFALPPPMACTPGISEAAGTMATETGISGAGTAGAAESSGAAILHDSHPLYRVKASLQVCVGTLELTVGALMTARQGDVLALDRALDQPVDLLLDGHLVARGQLVALDDFFAVRITDVPLALSLPAVP